MISDNAIPHCGLELGCCSRQIPYDLVAHDKMVHDEGYQQGRADAIDEYNKKIKECCHIVGSCDFEDLERIAEELKEKTE